MDPLRLAKFSRGSKVAMRKVGDKKLKAQLQYGERLASEAATAAARVDEWLLPHDAGGIEVEGMERTYQVSQVCSPGCGCTFLSSRRSGRLCCCTAEQGSSILTSSQTCCQHRSAALKAAQPQALLWP